VGSEARVRDCLGSAARLVVCGVYGVGRENLKRERENGKGRDGHRVKDGGEYSA
jgi:hypothetical protein